MLSQEVIMNLKFLKACNNLVRSKQLEIKELRASILRAQSYSDDIKSPSASNSSEELAIKLIDRTDEINKEIAFLYDKQKAIIQAIECLDDVIEQEIIRMYYIDGLSWKEIAIRKGGSEKTWQNIRRDAVKHLEEIIAQ